MAISPTINVRLDSEVKAVLEKIAKKDKRSLSSLVQKILTEYVGTQRKVRK